MTHLLSGTVFFHFFIYNYLYSFKNWKALPKHIVLMCYCCQLKLLNNRPLKVKSKYTLKYLVAALPSCYRSDEYCIEAALDVGRFFFLRIEMFIWISILWGFWGADGHWRESPKDGGVGEWTRSSCSVGCEFLGQELRKLEKIRVSRWDGDALYVGVIKDKKRRATSWAPG